MPLRKRAGKPPFSRQHRHGEGLSGSFKALQRFDEEREVLKRAIRLKPDDPQAHYLMGLNLIRKEDGPAALDEDPILQKLDATLSARLFQSICP
ncbi:MAG: hypothetical protein ACE5H3_02755 [Planctomycetota bacterium]